MNLLKRLLGTKKPALNKPVVTSSAVANHNDINVAKCIGCRKGISLFTEKDEEYTHVDFFATREAGESYKCENSETIGKFLIKNGNRGTLLPNEESKAFFTKQEMWWEDIISLAYDTLKEQKMVSEFFNDGDKELYRYTKVQMLQKFNFDGFLTQMEKGNILVDFDAITGHNHGTKFRMRQNCLPELYQKVTTII